MKVNVNIKRNFKMNGKEYNSIEELPEHLQESFKKAMVSTPDSGYEADAAAGRTKIIFNGKHYDSLDAIPHDERRLYEKILQAAEAGGAAPAIDFANISSSLRGEPGLPTTSYSDSNPQPSTFEPAFSPRTLAVIFILGGVLLLLYYLWPSK